MIKDRYSTGTIVEKYNTIIDKPILVDIFVREAVTIVSIYGTNIRLVITSMKLTIYLINKFNIRTNRIGIEIIIDEDNYIKYLKKNVEPDKFMISYTGGIARDCIAYKPNMDRFYASLPIFGFNKATIMTLLDLPDSLIPLLMEV